MLKKMLVCLSAITLSAQTVSAEDFSIDWHVAAGAGGGGTCAGGEFVLMGTSGQTAIDQLSGGEFILEGGFWPGVAGCSCPGEMTGDNKRNGGDIQAFIKCLLQGGGACTCADMNLDAQVTAADVQPFVTQLLTGPPCP